ncbi:general secretion pathway protein C [Legionella geestiana]|uniref:General secretion pathway protein C n=1 Tax=Legionella geestiana TaxID=45065 RepID=A0A0W0TPK3_9GAMM|nr:type II secretion system protein N [Legionella geestiana]KTC97501.1 general secretion pathway protein C [Legionella geestiana]STX54179.1 general secretion pathway protein C [Legionella geestiana]
MPDFRRLVAFIHEHPLWPPALLCVLLGLGLILTGLQAIQGSRSVDTPSAVTQPNAVAQKAFGGDAALFSTALFGEYMPLNLNDATVRQSTLDAEVAGILFSNNTELSQVILRFSDGLEQSFRVGDKLPGGAVIRRITADGILVWHNGALESLSLPKNNLTFEPPLRPMPEEQN